MDNQKFDLGIINGNVVFPGEKVEQANVYVKDGKIAAVTQDVLESAETVDAAGKYVMPGVIDPHTHMGLFAPLADELKSETKAALCGGVTTIGTFFGGPRAHSVAFPAIKSSINENSYVNVIPHLVIGNDEQLAEIGKYVNEYKVKSFKVYLNGVPGIVSEVSDAFIIDTMNEIKKFSNDDCILCAHCENYAIVADATKKMQASKSGEEMNNSFYADTHPGICEKEAINRLSNLALYAEFPVYQVHMFSKYGAAEATRLKPQNPYFSFETTSPYLSTTKDGPQGNALKMDPPFQGEEDMEALWTAVANGVIDTIGTDNVTETAAEKNLAETDYWKVYPGYAALEHHFPILLSEGVNKKRVSIERLAECTSKAPAQKFGLYPQKGAMLAGSDADIVIVDLDMEKTVTAAEQLSRSDFSIYEGRTIKGWPIMTIKDGQILVKDGEFVGEKATGYCVER